MQTRVLRKRAAAFLPLLVFTLVLEGCGGESTAGSTEVTAGTSAAARSGSWSGFRCLRRHRHCRSTTSTNNAPTISGVPATSVNAGSNYEFAPVATDADSDALTFSIRNRPSWASFSAADGRLSGTPTAAGTHAGIVISVTDGKASVALPAFDIDVVAAPGGSGTTNHSPTLGGAPATSVAVGNAYSFTPTASDADGDTLTFSIQNKPTWANFNSATGALTGTPTAGNVGTTSNIVISVSDGTAATSLAPFSIAVQQSATGSASLSWTAPTTNSDGSALTNLAGYRIRYGTTTAMSQTVQVSTAGVTSYTLGNLTSGTWYFAVLAYASNGAESPLSNTASKTIP